MIEITLPLVSYIFLMIISAIISTWGTFVTLPYENIPQIDAIKMALPYAWVDWIFLTLTINTATQYKIASPLQIIFTITMLKFFLTLVFTKYYLHKSVSLSDMIGFSIVVLAYLANAFRVVTKYYYGIDIDHKEGGETGTK
jgi:hypothetical protein